MWNVLELRTNGGYQSSCLLGHSSNYALIVFKISTSPRNTYERVLARVISSSVLEISIASFIKSLG